MLSACWITCLYHVQTTSWTFYVCVKYTTLKAVFNNRNSFFFCLWGGGWNKILITFQRHFSDQWEWPLYWYFHFLIDVPLSVWEGQNNLYILIPPKKKTLHTIILQLQMTGNLQLKVLKWLLCCSHVMNSTSEARIVVRPGHLESLTDCTYVCTRLMFLTRLCDSSQKNLTEFFLIIFWQNISHMGGLEISGKDSALGQWEELQNRRIQILFNSAPNPFAGRV